MIKSDRWIRRMAAEHRMIEPFEPGQVRHAHGQRIVSYGTSSYGYDIRCSNDFKIFTNINSTIVDPKAFDEKSFVDFRGDVCIIPPNSFALARTVEYFRIPRNVLTICLGKCVTGDTRIVDAETGAYRPIAESAAIRSTVALRDGKLQRAPVSAFVPQGRKPVFELRTRAGLRIKATANHPFRQPDGWTPLERLRVGDHIAVARDIPVFGHAVLPDWEASLLGLTIAEGQGRTPGHSPTVTSSDPALVALRERCVEAGRLRVAARRPGFGDRPVDHGAQGGVAEGNRTTRWLAGHGLDLGAGDRFVPDRIFTAPRPAVRLFLQALLSGDGGVYRGGEAALVEYCSPSRRLVEDVHHLLLRFGVFAVMRDEITSTGAPAHRIRIGDREQIARFAERIGFCPGTARQARLLGDVLAARASVPARIRGHAAIVPREAWSMMATAVAAADTSLHRLAMTTDRAQSPGMALAARVAMATRDEAATSLLDGPAWDVVDSVEPAGQEEVYDLTVPGDENFVANGIVVHNSTYARCGIIVNVTPFEPEWEGYVTLEFSNTTPLPAKIYANEGVAQVVFFESDEVCETSYKDRGGKYQGQQGVTLPKM